MVPALYVFTQISGRRLNGPNQPSYRIGLLMNANRDLWTRKENHLTCIPWRPLGCPLPYRHDYDHDYNSTYDIITIN